MRKASPKTEAKITPMMLPVGQPVVLMLPGKTRRAAMLDEKDGDVVWSRISRGPAWTICVVPLVCRRCSIIVMSMLSSELLGKSSP